MRRWPGGPCWRSGARESIDLLECRAVALDRINRELAEKQREVELNSASAPPPRERSAPAPVPEPRPSLKVLLVEGDPPTRRVMARLHQQRQYRILAAAGLKDALEIGQREEFDVLVRDIGLPDESGLDFIRALAARRPVRAIALIGFGMDDDARRCREAGFLAHLTKSVDFAKLEVVIRSIADSGRVGAMLAERA